MTLTAPRRVRGGTRVRPAERHVQNPQEMPAARPGLIATLVLPDVYRVQLDESCVGYVQLAGPVFVALRGSVYNTSLEVGQFLCLDAAVACLDVSRET
jgi:hypothetical protein